MLNALQDVKSSLVAYAKEQVHRKALQDTVAANERAVDISKRLYSAGSTNFLNVLDAERSLLSSQDALVRSDSAVTTDLVSLYKALGGGWETFEPNAQAINPALASATTQPTTLHTFGPPTPPQ